MFEDLDRLPIQGQGEAFGQQRSVNFSLMKPNASPLRFKHPLDRINPPIASVWSP